MPRAILAMALLLLMADNLLASPPDALAANPGARCEQSGQGAPSLPLRDGGWRREGLSEEETRSLTEALRTSASIPRWSRAPELVVLRSVMEYEAGPRTEYAATAASLTDEETVELIDDLTVALALLTGNAFTEFASVTVESWTAGERVKVLRPGQIVVGRYMGVRDRLKTIGIGGRTRRGGTISGGSVFLDEAYDRTNDRRGLLRTHELGHALGYDHVESRRSIMNARIGAEVTELDRAIAQAVFRQPVTQTPVCAL